MPKRGSGPSVGTYLLIDDSGPNPPQWHGGVVTDGNTGETRELAPPTRGPNARPGHD